jgi:O-antigen/teichoic acid export membrane protein
MRSGAGGVRDVSISFATTLYIQIVNIVTGLLAARLLLPEGRGELAALMLWPGLVAELGCLALSDALLYRLASNAAAPRVLFATIMAMAVGLCAVLIPIGFLILPFAMEGHAPDVVAAAWWYMALYLPTYFASLFVANMFQGRLEIVAWNVVRATVPTLYLAGIVVLGLSIAGEAPEFAAANVFAMLASAALGIALLARRGWFGLRPDAGEAKALAVYGAKAHASEILHSLRQKLDQAVVAKLMTASDLGIYAVALTVANGPLILVQTISNIAFPKISAQPTHDGKVLVFGRYLRLALAMVVAINIVLWVVNPWVIPLLFGQGFAPAVLIADVCLLGLVPYAAKVMFAAALKASDRALVIPRAELWGLAVVAPALFFLVPHYGLIGAAASLVIAQAATAVVLGQRLADVLHVRLLRLMIPNREDLSLLRDAFARAIDRA